MNEMPKHSVEAEQSVLGSIMIDHAMYAPVIDKLQPEHFFSPENQLIFKAIVGIIDKQGNPDVFSIGDVLKRDGQLLQAGDMDYIMSLPENTPTLDIRSVWQYYMILDGCLTRRNVEAAAFSVLEHVRYTRDIDDVLEAVQGVLGNIDNEAKASTTHIDKVLDKSLERMDELYRLGADVMLGCPTGLIDLDKETGGFDTGVHVIAGRPGMGKTVLAVQAAVESAKSGYNSLIMSLEMPDIQLGDRIISMEGGIPFDRIVTPGKLQEEDFIKAAGAIHKVKGLPLEIMDNFESKLARVISAIRGWHRKATKPGPVVIDYLQLLPTPGNDRVSGIGDITRRLKVLSNQLDIPIILVSQLSRNLEQRPNKRPIDSDLRDSGSIEQDADSIMFVYRDEVYNEDSQSKGIAEIIRGKTRRGTRGTTYVASELMYQRFGNLGYSYEPPKEEPKRRKDRL